MESKNLIPVWNIKQERDYHDYELAETMEKSPAQVENLKQESDDKANQDDDCSQESNLCNKLTNAEPKQVSPHKVHQWSADKREHNITYIGYRGTLSGEKPYKCDFCGASFPSSRNLKRHERTHTGEKPYKCEMCGAGFAEGGHLKDHKRTHTGERPYKCDMCGAGFAQSSTLTVHRRRHTGEKPYRCDICGVSFNRSGTLKNHKTRHQ